MKQKSVGTHAAGMMAEIQADKREGVANEVDRLRLLPLSSLKAEWHRAFPDRQMPARLSRDLLVRTMAWKMQEEVFGRFPPALAKKLERLSQQLRRSGSLDVEREVIAKPGTTLLREWRGQTHCVTAVEEGFIFRDQRFASLSEIARVITGTQWSGPRFFGLRQRSGKRVAAAPIDD